jgi:hypothetical protein
MLSEKYCTDYAIRLKSNASLKRFSKKNEGVFRNLHGNDFSHHNAVHDEFDYMAGSWKKCRRVICSTERVNCKMKCPKRRFTVKQLLPRRMFVRESENQGKSTSVPGPAQFP